MADLTVNAGGGAMYTTVAAAVAAAGTADWVVLQSDVTESITFYKNIAGIKSSVVGTRRKWSGTSGAPAWTINGAMSAFMEVVDIWFAGYGGTGQQPAVDLNATTNGQQVKFTRCRFSVQNQYQYTPCFLIEPQGLNTDNIWMYRCLIDGTNAYRGVYLVSSSSSYAVRLENTVIQYAAYGVDIAGTYSSPVLKMTGCTVVKCNTPFRSSIKTEIRNSLFVDGSVACVLSGSASSSDFQYCGFSYDTNTANGCQTGLFSAALFTDPANSDWSLKAGSSIIDTCSNLLTDDVIGTARPQGTASDMGAYEYIPVAAIARRRVILS